MKKNDSIHERVLRYSLTDTETMLHALKTGHCIADRCDHEHRFLVQETEKAGKSGNR